MAYTPMLTEGRCGRRPRIPWLVFITDCEAVDRVIDHLKLTFIAEKPPPSRAFVKVALMAAEERAEYF